MPAVVAVEMADGTTYLVEKDGFEGHPSDPMSWDEIEASSTRWPGRGTTTRSAGR